jgi:hypothetical protein
MKLDVFERFSNGKWLGLFQTNWLLPPKPGEIINLGSHGRAKVRSCDRQNIRHTDEPCYRVIVEKT